MAKGHKPRAGSRAFWPRKRAKRIFPSTKAPHSEETLPLVFAGYKAGMTQVVYTDSKKGSPTEGQDVVRPVTVLECPSLTVCGIRLYQKTHYGLRTLKTIWSEKLSKTLSRTMTVPKNPSSSLDFIDSNREKIADVRLMVHTNPHLSGLGKKKPEVFEIPLGGDIDQKLEYAKQKLGQEIKASDVFQEGEYVDSVAVTKGKGYQGPVRRFGIKIRPRKHEKKRRHSGVLGVRNVARVLPGKIPMAGQMGFQTRTELNKRIVKMDSGQLNPSGGWLNYGSVKSDYMLIEGSVPGPKKRLVIIRKGARAPEKLSTEVKEIILESQQGA